MNEREVSIPVTSLKDYLKETGITISTLSELSGINLNHLNKCLNGEVDRRNGKKRTMSAENLERLQESLHQLSLRLKYIFILYNTDFEEVKQNGHRYCKDCVRQLREQLSPYFRLLPFMQYALGWNRSKVLNTITNKDSITYGNIRQEDVANINNVLNEVATWLDTITLTKE